MSHHLDTEASRKDGRLNLCDVYVFDGQSPNTTVLILTVNPFAGQVSPVTFHPEALYDLKVDTDGDAVENLTYRVTFGEPDAQSAQQFQLNLVEGPASSGQTGRVLASGQTGQITNLSAGGRVWAGLAADPFFGNGDGLEQFKKTLSEQNRFDPAAFNNATNTFEPGNITGVVIEVPNAVLGSGIVRVWATITLVHHEQAVQINRAANPLIVHLFLSDKQLKDAHNQGRPQDDTQRNSAAISKLVAQVTELAGTAENPQAYGTEVVALLTPDVLTHHIGTPANYGFAGRNGRRLSDNGMDVVLSLLANRPLSAQVHSAGTYQAAFPYLVKPHAPKQA